MIRHPAGQDELVPALQVLSRCKLFQGLEREGLLAFAGAARTHVFRAGTDLYAEGDVSNGLWVVAKGRVRLHHADSAGQYHVVRFHAAGSILNLASAIDGRPLATAATALNDVVALYIPRDELLDIGRRHWAATRNALNLLCLEIRQRDVAAAVGALKDARSRIICSLLQMAREFGVWTGTGVRIDYQLSRQDIAEQAGIRVETAVRALSDLRTLGMVETEDQIVELLDVAALRDINECSTCELDCAVFNREPVPV
jgi:CRP/FNR family transcriptional regulator, cyclic AMP receptor protein